MKELILALVGAVGLAGSGAETTRDLWLAVDFDRPAVVAGEMIAHEIPADALVEGRYGKGCFFRRAARNVLLPTADFLAATNSFAGIGGAKPVADPKAGTLAFEGGEMRFLPQSSGQPLSWSSKVVSTTFAMEVKGPEGGELVLTPEITAITERQLKGICSQYKTFAPSNCLPNVATPRTFRLTGDWQRVWGVATYDIRTRNARRIGWRVKASGPVTMRKFLQQPTGYSHYANIVEPTEWVEGGSSRGEYGFTLGDRRLLESFPCSNGTFSCWLRTPDDWVNPKRGIRMFIYQHGWEHQWGFDGGAFCTAPGFGKAVHGFGGKVRRTNVWTHVAATWNADEFCGYVNGTRVCRDKGPKLCDMRKVGGSIRIGGDTMAGSADAILDDVAIFRRALSSNEVARLATAKAGLLAGGETYLSAPPQFTAFPRNFDKAALKFAVDAPKATALALEAEIGGVKLARRAVTLRKGANEVRCPFTPGDWRPGRHRWEMRLVEDGGRGASALPNGAVVRLEGTLTILPAAARGAFRIMSDGCGGARAIKLMKDVGFNCASITDDRRREIAMAEAAGLRLDLHFENPWAWKGANFDFAEITRDAEKRLRPFADDPFWDSTLVNSEVYGAGWGEEANKLAAWRAIAKRELGHDPVVAFSSSPCGIDWQKAGLKRPRGVLARSDVYDTLAWFMRRGMPQLMMTRLAADVVRKFSPDNTVWSEPSPSMENLDMSGDWIYSYDPFMCLGFLRYYEATPRGAGKRFMPYLAMGYWSPDFPEGGCAHPTQKDPKTGKPVPVWALQTVDELAIKSMMCIGGSAADSLAFFSLEWCWGQGCTNGALHEKGLPLVYCPGWGKYCVAEKDAPERFGAFIRRDFMPAALLLRNVPVLRAPIALLLPREIGYSGEFWWPRVTYVRQLMKLLSKQAIPFDVLFDEEFNVETLSKYRYVFYPQLNCITPEHDRVMRAMPSTTTFLHDDNTFTGAAQLRYPNFARVKGLSMHFPEERKNLDLPMSAWMTPRVADLRGRLAAWSDEDGTNAWTFVKAYKGVRYVTVVNNARRLGGCPQTDLKTNAWYRPMGAPQRITTHFTLPPGGQIYEFNASTPSTPSTRSTLSTLYSPAQSRVFVIHPKRLAAPKVAFVAGRAGAPRLPYLRVTIADADGAPAPGRTVVRLDLTDPDGKRVDESGLYVVESGKAEIPLRFAKSDPKSGFFSKWKAVVTDLTTGESGSERFAGE